jgi:uncharacterized protein (TIGR02996 family)
VNPDLAALLAGLRDNPEDEVARLALADWCLDQPDSATQARGEHIRLHIQRGQRTWGQDGYREPTVRIRALEGRYRRHWLGQLRVFTHRCDFAPGGLVRVELTEGRLAQAMREKPGPLSTREWAWVTEMVCRTPLTPEEMHWLGKFLPEGYLRSFDMRLNRRGGRQTAVALVTCPGLAGIRDIRASGAGLGDEGGAYLAGSPRLAHLQSLWLDDNDLHQNGFEALAGSPHLAALLYLKLDNNPLSSRAGNVPGRATWGNPIAGLSLASCNLKNEGVRDLTSSWAPTGLCHLNLGNNNLSTSAAERLAGWPALASVRELYLQSNPLSNPGVAALARTPYVGQVRVLFFNNTNLGDEGARELAQSIQLSELHELHLDDPALTAEGYRAFLDTPGLPSLRLLRCRFPENIPRPLVSALVNRFCG